MTHTHHTFVTANILPRNRKNDGKLDITLLRKEAPYKRLTILTDLNPCLN